MDELQKELRRGNTIKLDDKLQAGGAGEIETSTKGKHALRKGNLERKGSQVLNGFDIDESSDKSVAEQLRDALTGAAARVIDVCHYWASNPRLSDGLNLLLTHSTPSRNSCSASGMPMATARSRARNSTRRW